MHYITTYSLFHKRHNDLILSPLSSTDIVAINNKY